MAILKRRSISITHEYKDVYEFLENSKYNLSKYVCELIREDMKKNKGNIYIEEKNSDPCENNSNNEDNTVDNNYTIDNAGDEVNDNAMEVDASWL